MKQPMCVWLLAALLSGVLLGGCGASATSAVLPAPLYFVSAFETGESHIVRLERDGTTRTNIVDEPGVWEGAPSPVDGSLAYITHDADGDSLIRTDVAGKQRTVLFHISGVSIDSILWSPDGKMIACELSTGTPSSPYLPPFGIYVIATGDGTPKLIQAEGLMDVYQLISWSPDSRRLLLYGHQLVVKDLASGTQVDVGYPGEALWSRDSSALYIAMAGWTLPDKALVRTDASTGKETPYILGKPEQYKMVYIWGLHLLEDGSFYAFLATTDQQDGPYASGVVNPRFALVHISNNGMDIQKLSDKTYEQGEALWSADGSGVLFNSYNAPLLWLPANGGESTVIIENIDRFALRNLRPVHWGPP